VKALNGKPGGEVEGVAYESAKVCEVVFDEGRLSAVLEVSVADVGGEVFEGMD